MTDLSQSVIIQIPKRIRNASGSSNTPRTDLTNLNLYLNLIIGVQFTSPSSKDPEFLIKINEGN